MLVTGFVCVLQYLWVVGSMFLMPGLSYGLQPSSAASQFEVQTLPDSPPLPRSWAGRIPIPGVEDGNALFFWLFETEDAAYDDNLIIWFNGGPGCASIVGLMTGSGPLLFVGNSTQLTSNPNSWTKLGHLLYVDQPAGTGLSTASDPYPVTDNARVTSDFYAWLHAFYAYFPELLSKRVHMIGESYAGIYIPYFAQQILNNHSTLPINLHSVSMGDGTWGNGAAMSSVAMGTYIKSQSALLECPANITDAFAQADETCGFTQVMAQANQYPPQGKIMIPGNPEYMNFKRHIVTLDEEEEGEERFEKRDLTPVLDGSCDISPTTPDQVLTSIYNSTCYGPCATFSTALDYFDTVSASGSGKPCYDVYNINYGCNTIDPNPLLASYFSRADVQAALHVSNGNTTPPVTFTACNSTIMNILLGSPELVEPPAYFILPDMITNHNVSVHIYNGEYDMLINHFGTELCLQNMTWNGAQGLSQKPYRAFYADDAAPSSVAARDTCAGEKDRMPRDDSSSGAQAGIWAEERGLTYHFVWGAGHMVVTDKPSVMFAYVRDVVIAM